jgi:CubicO group peptidase (beta-lactamase class C family)
MVNPSRTGYRRSPPSPGRVRHALNRFWFAGTAPNYNKIGSMSNMETIYKPAFVKAFGGVRPLMAHSTPPAIKLFADGYGQNEETLLDNSRITGLLLMKDGQIVTERYQYDRKPEHKFTSYSMAKTVIGILIGAALKDGYIKSLNDTADTYVKDLKGPTPSKVW